MWLRRIVGLALILSLVVLGVVQVASGSHGRAASKCGGKISVLVWPHGHPVILSVNFPAIVNPHVEVYVGWNAKYPEGLYGGYVVGGTPKGGIPVGDVNLHLNCINYGAPAKATSSVPGGVRVTGQTALKCTFSGSGVFDLIERGGGSRVLVLHNGPKVLLRADVSAKTASVTVPKGACTKAPVPR
jgi:hypothetical protein